MAKAKKSKRKVVSDKKIRGRELESLFNYIDGGISNLSDSLDALRIAEDSEEFEDAAMDAQMEAEGLLADVLKVIKIGCNRG